ncbi:nucleotide sugar dehydrogenase [Acidobacteria bacterium AH-259-A15]|nr:nucleotide sugar dehydrogenase [Acidobacteria bacterium AH-259-A15]
MKIAVFGIGYVGCTLAIYLARAGFHILGVDIVRDKLDLLNSGQLPIFEPGLQELFAQVRTGASGGSFRAVDQSDEQIYQSAVSMICVGTPTLPDNSIDLTQIQDTCKTVGKVIKSQDQVHHVIVRSTIPPGTTEDLVIPGLEKSSGKRAGRDFLVTFYPEFLRQGQGLKDMCHPSLNIVGCKDDLQIELIKEVFKDVTRPPVKTSIRTAEMIKYANNTFHAVKVAFTNEIATIAKAYSVDSTELMNIFCSDNVLNISSQYMRPGFAFGGSCLSKELRGALHLARKKQVDTPLLKSVVPSNVQHIERLISGIQQSRKNSIGFLGITFKSETDDIRESPLITVIETLLKNPSYKKTKAIVVCDKELVEKRLKSLFSGQVRLITDQQQFLESVELLVLGPYAIEEDIIDQYIGFEGKIIDLLWHPVPRKLMMNPGYERLC